jgi:hypothetical protein
MRKSLTLITAIAALGVAAPAASAADGEIELKRQPTLVKTGAKQIELTFTTDAALPRRGDGKIEASAKIGRYAVSIGRFKGSKGDPRDDASPRGHNYIAYLGGKNKLRVGTHVPVTISVDGQDPIKLKVTLAKKFW